MVRKSLWDMTASARERKPLAGDISVNTVVIGAGMAGILTAHMLEQAGVSCVVLEAGRIGGGQTGHTTAKITSQHGMIYDRLLQSVGSKMAGQYAGANQEAIERYRILAEKYGIDCQWQDCPACPYTTENTRALCREYEAARRLGLPVKYKESARLPFPVKGVLEFSGQACFHPLKFLYKIAEDLQVYEHTKVKHVKNKHVLTDKGTVKAQNIVFACHYPFVNVPGYYFMRMHQERSYVMAVKNAEALDGMYYGIDRDGLSFRNMGDYLLLGGGGGRTGQQPAESPYEYLGRMADLYWPGCEEAACWSAQDCMSLDGIPYIGRFSRIRPNWYVATGFGKWGMTGSMVSAMIISSYICGRECTYGDVFSPQRLNISASAGDFFENIGYAAAGFFRQAMWIPRDKIKPLHPGQGAVVGYKGRKYGVYKEPSGNVYMVPARCPHLGCLLKWNNAEKSWDCPCHGSRFDYRGRRLDEPSQEDIPCRVLKR